MRTAVNERPLYRAWPIAYALVPKIATLPYNTWITLYTPTLSMQGVLAIVKSISMPFHETLDRLFTLPPFPQQKPSQNAMNTRKTQNGSRSTLK